MPMIMASKKCKRRDCMGIVFSTVIKIHLRNAPYYLIMIIFSGWISSIYFFFSGCAQ